MFHPDGINPPSDLALSDRLSLLRARIRRIERPAGHGILPFGDAAIDRSLPGGGLALGAVHEILGAGNDEEDAAVPAAFAAALIGRLGVISGTRSEKIGSRPKTPSPPAGPLSARACARLSGGASSMRQERAGVRGADPIIGEISALRSRTACPEIIGWRPLHPTLSPRPAGGEGKNSAPYLISPPIVTEEKSGKPGDGPVLWCSARGDLYGPGLALYGLDPGRLVLVTARRDEEILWAMEEGLRQPGLAAVVGEIGHLPTVAGRRLQLAAERSGVTAFVLRRWPSGTAAAVERGRPSVAATRWRVAALPAADLAGEPGIGRPRWRLDLLRCRGGAPMSWQVEAPDATDLVSVSAELADRPAPRRVADARQPVRRAG